MDRDLGRFLIAVGAIIALIGVLLSLGTSLRLGRLPGDITISRGGLRIYVPLGTCLAISVIATLLIRILGSR